MYQNRWNTRYDFPGSFDKNHRTMIDCFDVKIYDFARFPNSFQPKDQHTVAKVMLCHSNVYLKII
jgi:hypothetical protein